MKLLVLPLALSLTACATTQGPPAPSLPVLSCDDCSGLRYYGHQAPPQSETAKIIGVLAGAATQIAGYGFASDAAKSITTTAASAGRVQVVEQPDPTVVRPEVVIVRGGQTAE
mgnify:CR=1 FL=1